MKRAGLMALSTVVAGALTLAFVPGASVSAEEDAAAKAAANKAQLLQVLEAKRQFAENVGLKPFETRMILHAKLRRGQIQKKLRDEATVLASALETKEADEAWVKEKVDAYLAHKQEAVTEMQQLDEWLIRSLRAEQRPKVMGALIIMDAVDNGLRPLCGIQHVASGGVSPTPPH